MSRDAFIWFISKFAGIMICMGVSSVYAQGADISPLYKTETVFSGPSYHLVQDNGNGQAKGAEVPSGTLVLPDTSPKDDDNTAGKKCMTVCARWGEECTYVNRGVGGTTRNCRRSCQQFTEECF